MNDFKKQPKFKKIAPESNITEDSESQQQIKENSLSIVKKHEIALSQGVHRVQEYREHIIKKGERFKNPHSLKLKKKSLVKTSLILVSIMIVIFYLFSYLYIVKLKKDNFLAYSISRVTPFRIGELGGVKASYYDYLFELRHELHYLEKKENLAIRNPDHIDQYNDLRTKSLDKTLEVSWSKNKAKQLKIKVEDSDVESKIDAITSQFGEEGQNSLKIALNTYYGWSESDLRRSIKNQLYKEKISYQLDTKLAEKRNQLNSELNAGADFSVLVEKYSDDAASKANKGSIGLVKRDSSILPSDVTSSLFKLNEGQISGPVETASGIYYVKVDKVVDDSSRQGSIVVLKSAPFSEIVKNNN
ncbi:MAG TPA: peptidylprolyl isomerase [Candidatus Saccharibacteria bacterium]|nr:peptidylprolyl isomerase [Candidatus Saccharibacteria bacterium]